jgi:hypothetical protein
MPFLVFRQLFPYSIAVFEVTLENATQANMLCMILRQALGRSLQTAVGQRTVAKLNGSLRIRAGRMKAFIRFAEGNARILPGVDKPATATIEGSLASLTESGSLLRSMLGVLKGRMRVRGRLSFAMKVFKLMKPPGK